MPAFSSRNTRPGVAAPETSVLACRTCGKSFATPARHGETVASLVEEESARCSRMREITQQRQALAARTQAGFAGVLGNDTVDTVDLVDHRRSLAQLDAALRAEAEELAKVMRNMPGER
jgi:hypothetical protein